MGHSPQAWSSSLLPSGSRSGLREEPWARRSCWCVKPRPWPLTLAAAATASGSASSMTRSDGERDLRRGRGASRRLTACQDPRWGRPSSWAPRRKGRCRRPPGAGSPSLGSQLRLRARRAGAVRVVGRSSQVRGRRGSRLLRRFHPRLFKCPDRRRTETCSDEIAADRRLARYAALPHCADAPVADFSPGLLRDSLLGMVVCHGPAVQGDFMDFRSDPPARPLFRKGRGPCQGQKSARCAEPDGAYAGPWFRPSHPYRELGGFSVRGGAGDDRRPGGATPVAANRRDDSGEGRRR